MELARKKEIHRHKGKDPRKWAISGKHPGPRVLQHSGNLGVLVWWWYRRQRHSRDPKGLISVRNKSSTQSQTMTLTYLILAWWAQRNSASLRIHNELARCGPRISGVQSFSELWKEASWTRWLQDYEYKLKYLKHLFRIRGNHNKIYALKSW